MLRDKASTKEQGAEASNITGKSPTFRAVSSSLEAILFFVATVVVVAAIGPVAGWWHYEVIESGSMTPALRVGGVAVLWPEPVTSVRAGQIIAFHPPGSGNTVRIHRVVAVTDHDGQVWVTTKGDANNTPDAGPVRLVGKTAYAEHYFVPYVGYLGAWLYKQSTRVALEVALFTLMVAGGLFLIWSKKDDEKEEAPATELVIPRRWPRQEHAAAPPYVAAEKASTAATASLLALSHIFTASSEGGDEATIADKPVSTQPASGGGMSRLFVRARLVLALVTVVSLAVVGNPQAADAQFLYAFSAGSQTDQTAVLGAPTAPASSTPACASSIYHTAVPLSWAGSSALDEDGNYLVGYYGIWRSVDAGAYSLAGSTSGAPPATTFSDDTAIDALPATTYYYTSGNTLEADYGGATTAVGTYDFGAQENLIGSTTTAGGSWTYVAESGPSSHNVLVVGSLHGSSNYDKIVSTVTLAGSAPLPIAVAMAPNGSAAYVLDATNDQVDVIPVPTPAPTYTVTTTIPVGLVGNPDAMAVTPSSSELLVANYKAGTVTVINTATNTVAVTVPLPRPAGGQLPAPMGIVVLPSGADAYVVDRANNEVDELSLSGATAGTFVAADPVGSQGATGTPADIDMVQNPTAGTEIYVGDGGTDEFSVIAPASNTVMNFSTGGGNTPVALVGAPDGCFVALAQTAGTVFLISTTTNTVSKTLAGTPATCLAMQGDSSTYLENSGSVAAVPTLLSYELQAVQTTAGSGFKSAFSPPVNVSLGAGQVP